MIFVLNCCPSGILVSNTWLVGIVVPKYLAFSLVSWYCVLFDDIVLANWYCFMLLHSAFLVPMFTFPALSFQCFISLLCGSNTSFSCFAALWFLKYLVFLLCAFVVQIFGPIWCYLMSFTDIWWYFMIFDAISWYLVVFGDVWRYLVLFLANWCCFMLLHSAFLVPMLAFPALWLQYLVFWLRGFVVQILPFLPNGAIWWYFMIFGVISC